MRNDAGDETQLSLQTTLDEHHGCMRAVEAVEDILGRRPDSPGSWLATLLERLGTLRATLAEHFEHEAGGALYREIPFRNPQVAGTIDRLAAEHEAMLGSVDALMERGTALEDPETFHLRELNGRVQLLVATIRRHEAEENEIIVNSYWTETGGGD